MVNQRAECAYVLDYRSDPIPALRPCVVASLFLQVSTQIHGFYDNDSREQCELRNRVEYFRGN